MSIKIEKGNVKRIGRLLTKGENCDIIYEFQPPVWWNWQTRGTQNPVVAIPCGFDPHHRHQKIRQVETCRIFLSKPQAWHIITARSVVHIINPFGAVSHHALACLYLRLDDIQHFVLVICKTSSWWYARLRRDSCKRVNSRANSWDHLFIPHKPNRLR